MPFWYAMKRQQRQKLRAVVLLLGASVLLATPSTPQTVARQTTARCTQAPEAPGSVDRGLAGSLGELSLVQKHTAFADVLDVVRFGEYTFPVAVTQSQRTTFAPVLLKSIAGIESDWTQYVNSSTNVNQASCDFGLMQINEVARAALFSKQPSLRSDTRGNIAASAQALSELWDAGLFGTLPLVNDGDPSWLPNWYYVLSSYNGGPGSEIWVNNPACGIEGLLCGKNYTGRRPATEGADWNNLAVISYPYQERVLNNLPFPRKLGQHSVGNLSEWLAEGLGIQRYTSLIDSGLLPEDTIFVRTDPSTGELLSYAPNLILFRHRTWLLDPNADSQTMTLEYDLPFSALVTTTLVLRDGTELPLCTQTGKAGWNRHFCRATTRLQDGDSYRIRAERGSPAQPASYYLGQYRQRLRFQSQAVQQAQLSQKLYLPLVQNTGRPILLLNHDFSWVDPQQSWKPDYWDVQVLASRDPIAGLPEVTGYCGVRKCRRAGSSTLRLVP